ncbi:MAG: tRNA uridine-5-carboxymethylaminomethyl(34) synthesis GTPase MnmE [Lachnospiraceae bacterium]|nr:tRNA uridine-5-carboxymethylaminomethyl(34) synthesis GTPase MnmE [Lachnospiraceae bacterium]
MFENDTIAAISTALSEGGIGIIRLSGSDAVEICDKVYKGKNKISEVDSHTIHYGHICDGDEVLDEVMVSVMRAPKSYTKEDVVEINCHGSVFLQKEILSLLFKKGARPAEPGEFTKRAFLNGRIDLSQAESVMDVISSQNEFAAKNSLRQLEGYLKDSVISLRNSLIYEIAYIESALDDPEHISLDGYGKHLDEVVSKVMKEVKGFIDSAKDGSYLKDGIRTVIVGKPNVGKSSLLNVLAKKERAIVTDIPGTTRDTLEEQISFGEFSLHVVDTAGIRKTDDTVEKIGVKKALSSIEDADLILYVVDSSSTLDEEDQKIMDKIKDLKVIVLLNKSDLESNVSEDVIQKNLIDKKIISVSAANHSGVEELKNEIRSMFFHGEISLNNEVYITNERQKYLFEEAFSSLAQVKISIENQMPEDFYSIDLMDAYESLGKIVGESVDDDLVNEIFSKFCMGK